MERAAEIELDGRTVAYRLRVSDRARWIRADIALRRGLRVTLPAGVDESRAAAFLRSRARWILRTLDRFERLAKRIPERRLEHGARVPYLGGELTLDVVSGEPRVGRLGDGLVVSVRRSTERCIRRALVEWYRAEAEREFALRAKGMASRHGLRYRKTVVSDARTRWGSCSSNGTIALNWRLMMAPEAVVEYMVAHELGHTLEPNHSKRYWAGVERLCPAWREQEAWLRRHGVGLVL